MLIINYSGTEPLPSKMFRLLCLKQEPHHEGEEATPGSGQKRAEGGGGGADAAGIPGPGGALQADRRSTGQ